MLWQYRLPAAIGLYHPFIRDCSEKAKLLFQKKLVEKHLRKSSDWASWGYMSTPEPGDEFLWPEAAGYGQSHLNCVHLRWGGIVFQELLAI